MINQLQLAWARRDIIQYLVMSELRTTYRNKALGYLWTILDPLIMMGIYILLVVGIFGRGGPQYPILLFTSLLAWWWFAQSMSASVDAISSKGKLIQTMYFARIVLPISKVTVGFVKYLFGMIVLVPMLLIYDAQWTPNMLYLPVIIGVQFILTIGVSLVLSVVGVYFKDAQNMVKFAIRTLFFLSPALYSVADRVPERFQTLYMLNPFAALFESYRNVLIRGEGMNGFLLVALAISIVVTVAGLLIFDKYEPELAKQV